MPRFAHTESCERPTDYMLALVRCTVAYSDLLMFVHI
eukprot:SAG11_NODE_1324_length_5199_cov_5.524902_5_plen_37_part_00